MEDYVKSLEADFGDFRVATNMRSASLLVGEHGIDGLMSDWVHPVIDVLDVEHPTYEAMRSLVLSFSQQLALRLRDFTKVILILSFEYRCPFDFCQAEGKTKARDDFPSPADKREDAASSVPEATAGNADPLKPRSRAKRVPANPPKARLNFL